MQVLEAGIAIHSVLIGVSLGVASDTGVVRPLLAALTFHQFFEGVALGACFLEVGTCPSTRLLPGSIGTYACYNINSLAIVHICMYVCLA